MTQAQTLPNREMPAALPLQMRLAPVGSVDTQARTAEVVFSTGAPVRRQRWIGWDTLIPFDEILTVSREAINMERLNAGAPALDSHSTWTTSSQVGVIENARVEKSNALARVRFPSKGVDPAADRMFSMVDEGIIRNVSVGYSIDEIEIHVSTKPGEIEQRIVKRWTPWEISFVTVPADPGAQVRAADAQRQFPIEIRGVEIRAGSGLLGPIDMSLVRMRMRRRASFLVP